MLDRKLFRLLIVALALGAFTLAAHAQYTGIRTFDGWWDGSNPYYAEYLAQDINGNIHGTMPQGGAASVYYGTWFDYPIGGAVTIHGLSSSTQPQNPYSGLTLGIDGNLYGTTVHGGGSDGNGSTYGTVFTIVNGQASNLHPFTGGMNGGYPVAPPIQAPDGNLYGVTWETSLVGYVYQILMSNGVGSPGWVRPLPAGSQAGLILASDGNLYGTTAYGGLPIKGVAQSNNNGGALFQVTLSGVVTGIFNFDASTAGNNGATDGYRPYGGVIQGADGYLYGTTSEGGAYAGGTLYRVQLNGTYFSAIHHFQFNDGIVPTGGLMQGSDGYIYGLASADGYIQEIFIKGGGPLFKVGGTIFRTDTTGANFVRLFTFYGDNLEGNQGSGLDAYATPLLHTSGTIYGLTQHGGSGTPGSCSGCYANGGEFFSYGTGMAPFISVVSQRNAKMGDWISIIGQGFLNATGVTFGGTAVNMKWGVQIVSDNFMKVNVPSGAKTGKIAVQELNGVTLSTPYNFTITCSGPLCLHLP
jgi:uncharacterized repeat protein (TIGR03803 family)